MTGMIFVLTILGVFTSYTQGGLNPIQGYSTKPTDNAEMYCLPDKPPRTIRWYKDGKELTTTPGKYDLRQNTESLEVIQVGESDVGEYVCVDKDNGDMSKTWINIGAWAESNADIVKSKGESFTVECHAWGYPMPVIKWYKDGSELTAGPRYTLEDRTVVEASNMTLKGGKLVVTDAQSSDTGKYKCVASNKNGVRAGSTSVLVKDPLSFLWPVLGILALLILLGVGIGLFLFFRNRYKKNEKKRNAKWKKLEAERQKQMQAVAS